MSEEQTQGCAWLYPFWFFAHSKVWELGKICHGRQPPVYLFLVLLLPLLL